MIFTVTLNPALDKTIELENFSEGSVNRSINERLDAGGKGINAARVIKELGGESTVIAFTGGEVGRQLVELVESYKIKTQCIEISGNTRINIKLQDIKKQVLTDINAPGPIIEGNSLLNLLAIIKANLKKDDIIIFSGSIPRGIDYDIYNTLIKLANDSKAIAFLDAEGEALVKGIEAKPFLIKPNIHELEKSFNISIGTVDETVHACRNLVNMGAGNVFLSMGEKGSIFVNKDSSYFINAVRVSVKSTVGAGDALVGGFAYGIHSGYSIVEALKLSVGCAAAAVSMEGTQPGKKDDIELLAKTVKVQNLQL